MAAVPNSCEDEGQFYGSIGLRQEVDPEKWGRESAGASCSRYESRDQCLDVEPMKEVGAIIQGESMASHSNMERRCWGDYSTEDKLADSRVGDEWLMELGEADSVIDFDPILMLPPPSHSDWVLKKVAEVKRRLGYAFQGIE